jgi:hypothetical protein
MKKLRLDVAVLRVDSFEAGAMRAGAGTVLGHATKPATCGTLTGVTNCDCTLGCNTVPCTTA